MKKQKRTEKQIEIIAREVRVLRELVAYAAIILLVGMALGYIAHDLIVK